MIFPVWFGLFTTLSPSSDLCLPRELSLYNKINGGGSGVILSYSGSNKITFEESNVWRILLYVMSIRSGNWLFDSCNIGILLVCIFLSSIKIKHYAWITAAT